MTGIRFIVVLMIYLTAGCAGSQGLHPEPLQNLLREEEARFSGPQHSPPSTTIPSQPAPPASANLGLYLKPTGFFERAFEWTDRDREAILAWAQQRQPNGPETRARFVPQSSLKGDTLAELRASAARYGADLLVMFDGAAAVDRYNNYKAPLLYWTILGAYLADGTQSDALCLIRGSVWDVKTGTLLFADEAEGRSQTVGPAAFVDDHAMVLAAKQQALASLLQLMEQRRRNGRPATN
jgi:hypothetical protein